MGAQGVEELVRVLAQSGSAGRSVRTVCQAVDVANTSMWHTTCPVRHEGRVLRALRGLCVGRGLDGRGPCSVGSKAGARERVLPAHVTAPRPAMSSDGALACREHTCLPHQSARACLARLCRRQASGALVTAPAPNALAGRTPQGPIERCAWPWGTIGLRCLPFLPQSCTM